jgi:hypothetical protein
MKKETTNTPTAKRGRPTVAGSKRQAVLAMRAAKVAAGGTIQRGRPKMVKDDTIEVTVKAPKTRKVTDTVAILNMDDLANIINDAK